MTYRICQVLIVYFITNFKVYGIGTLSEFKIKMYFESKRSNGGAVERINRFDETNCVVVTFENVEGTILFIWW